MDSWLEGFLHGPALLWVILLVSLTLGLRHASEPDHLAVVSTLSSPFRTTLGHQATHVDLQFDDRFYRPEALTQSQREHMSRRHDKEVTA